MGLCSISFGQNYTINKKALKLVDSAKVAFCNGDTSLTITTLESIEINYPTDALIVSTNRALAQLYIAKGKTAYAKAKLLYAFSYTPTNFPAYREDDVCDKILKRQEYSRAKADLCVDLSKIYLAQKAYDSSLYFLNLADSAFLPYTDCANGIYMYRSYLSPFFADHYLATGDTAKAFARLLDFFMNPNGNTNLLAQKLKTLLLQKWTPEQIKGEVDKGLRTLQFTKIGDSEFLIQFTLFGHTIRDYGHGKVGHYKKLYKSDPGLKILQED